MASKIKPKRSYTTGAVPTTSDLDTNEVAINWTDGKLYTKTSSGNIVSVTLGTGGGGSGLSWSSVPSSATSTGTAGQIAYDGSWYYICTATNTWVRASTQTWFTPSSITGLQLWLDASDAMTTFDATSGGSTISADVAVARWEDKSGNSRHFTQSTSSNRPLRKTSQQNGRDALLFDGINDGLVGGDYLDGNSGSIAVFAVVKRTGSSQNHEIVAKAFDGGGWVFRLLSDGKLYAGNFASNLTTYTDRSTSAAISATAFTLVSLQFSAGAFDELSMRRNGVALALGSANSVAGGLLTPVNTSNSMRIGFSASAGTDYNNFAGNIGEVLIYNSSLSSTDRSAIESYLMSKWGIV